MAETNEERVRGAMQDLRMPDGGSLLLTHLSLELEQRFAPLLDAAERRGAERMQKRAIARAAKAARCFSCAREVPAAIAALPLDPEDTQPKMSWTPPEHGADLVRALRKRVGMTQEEFAHEIAVTTSVVRRWETGVVEPSRLAWLSMCDFARKRGVPLDEDTLNG